MLPNYDIDQFGVIHQVEREPFTYDKAYLSYYEDLSDRTIKLGYQRLGWVLGVLNKIPQSVLEIGYGSGTFIEAAQITGVPKCGGSDIASYPLPDGVEFFEWDQALSETWELVGMFDVLEHIPDLDFLGRLNAQYIAIAVPYCRWKELGDDWFRDWRMRLPDEHLHHFDEESLPAIMEHYGFKCQNLNTFEDGIRLRKGETGPNVLSGFFEKV